MKVSKVCGRLIVNHINCITREECQLELQGGIKKVYITDQSSVDDTYSQNYITDEEIVTTSAKEVYFLWLSRLVILCAIISFGFLLCWSLVVFRLAPEIVVEPLLIDNKAAANL